MEPAPKGWLLDNRHHQVPTHQVGCFGGRLILPDQEMKAPGAHKPVANIFPAFRSCILIHSHLPVALAREMQFASLSCHKSGCQRSDDSVVLSWNTWRETSTPRAFWDNSVGWQMSPLLIRKKQDKLNLSPFNKCAQIPSRKPNKSNDDRYCWGLGSRQNYEGSKMAPEMPLRNTNLNFINSRSCQEPSRPIISRKTQGTH